MIGPHLLCGAERRTIRTSDTTSGSFSASQLMPCRNPTVWPIARAARLINWEIGLTEVKDDCDDKCELAL